MPNGEDVDASFGPSAVLRSVWTRPGQVQGTCPPLAHTRRSRAHILTASATTIHENGDGTDSNRFPDCSVIPGNPSTEQTGEFPWGFHETKRETTRAGGAGGAAGAVGLDSGEALRGKGVQDIDGRARLRVMTPGGGGFGCPLERDPDAVLADVLEEVVSVDAAARIYGVVVTATGEVDWPATRRRRVELRQPAQVGLT